MRSGRRLLRAVVAGLVVSASLAGLGPALQVAADDPVDPVIDDFATDQAPLVLTYPPSGTSASSSVGSPAILGGERDASISLMSGANAGDVEQLSASGGSLAYTKAASLVGQAIVAWDGTDGSPALDHTGLGDVDLTGGGTKDALAIDVVSVGQPILIVVTVFTDAANSSFALIPITAAGPIVVPFELFEDTGAGAGADFSNAGAITMEVNGPLQSMSSLVIDSLAAVSTARATMSDDVGVDGFAEPGDTIEYTVSVTNPEDAFEFPPSGAMFDLSPTPGATLVPGSVSTSQGTVVTGNGPTDTAVSIDIGELGDGAAAAVTITFDLIIGPFSGDVANQGTLTYSNVAILTATESDDPDTLAFSDETITAVVEPIPTVAIADAGNVVEGVSGTSPASFAVSLSGPYSEPVSVRAISGGGTASAGLDYTSIDEIVTFDPGETVQLISVDVFGDDEIENDETLAVVLSESDNATIGRATALATIVDDDELPASTTTTVAPTDSSPSTTALPPSTTALPASTTALTPPALETALPETGSDTSVVAPWALLALGLGGALAVAIRRRHN